MASRLAAPPAAASFSHGDALGCGLRGFLQLHDQSGTTLAPPLFAFFLALGNIPIPLDVAGVRSVGEVARAAVREFALAEKLGRAITAADVRLFVISRMEAQRLLAGGDGASCSDAAKGAPLGALDAFYAESLCEGSCLLIELREETSAAQASSKESGSSNKVLSSMPSPSTIPELSPTRSEPPAMPPSTAITVQRYRTHREGYANKADFKFSGLLISAFRSSGECADDAIAVAPLASLTSSRDIAATGAGSGRQAIIIGGANEGLLIRSFARDCPGLKVTGLEIQGPLLTRVQAGFEAERAAFPRVQMLHMGMNDVEGEANFAGGDQGSEHSSIMDPHGSRTRFSDWPVAPYKVKVLPLTLIYSRHVAPAALAYVAVDVEGHEPLVIRGMGLNDIGAQRIFSAFQFEIGGTWAPGDPRHPLNSWLLPEAATHLVECGYELYVIGESDLLRVPAEFFEPGKGADENEGFGPTPSPGNVLALRREFAHPAVVKLVDLLTWHA